MPLIIMLFISKGIDIEFCKFIRAKHKYKILSTFNGKPVCGNVHYLVFVSSLFGTSRTSPKTNPEKHTA